MKKLTLILLYMLIFSASSVAQAEYNMLFSEKGYPYNNLIARTEQVKVFYTKVAADIKCKVEVKFDNKIWKTDELKVTQKQFDKAPLASCLPRGKAKQLLASTFN